MLLLMTLRLFVFFEVLSSAFMLELQLVELGGCLSSMFIAVA